MNTPGTFDAGRPRTSGPIRRLSRPLAPLAVPLAGTRWFAFYAVLRHTGRTTGKTYSTPVVTRPTPDGFVIPLPFGNATQWAKNLFAAGGGSIQYAGRAYPIGEPRVVRLDVAGAHLHAVLRFVATRLGLRQYVVGRRISG